MNDLLEQAVRLHQQGQLAAAEQRYHQILAQQAGHPDALHLLGVIAKQCGNYQQAEALILRAIENGTDNPNLPDYFNNLGEVLRATFRPQQAMLQYQQAIQRRPGFISALHNLGNCYQQTGDHETALQYYRQVMQADPGHYRAEFAAAISLLILGRYEQGWLGYQSRMLQLYGMRYLPDPQKPDRPLPTPTKALTGEYWLDKTVLVVADQGLGDELFFLRYLPRLAARVKQVYYQPGDKLRPLLARLPTIELLSDNQGKSQVLSENQTPAEFDAIVAVGELPLLTGMLQPADVLPALRLTPLPEQVQALQQQLSHLPRPWLGVTWRGGEKEKLYKEAPLPELQAILNGFSGTVFILQRQPTDDEIASWNKQSSYCLVDACDVNDDLEQALAMLFLLDDYITVSNTNVHLRAGLGQSSRVLLPLSVDFRWPNQKPGQTSPWFYQHHCYHQQPDGSWRQAFTQLQQELQSLPWFIAGSSP